MSTEEDCLDSDPRQLEYARTLALPQALSLDLSPVALMLVLGNDPLIPLCGGGEDPVQRLTSSVAQRLLVDLCNIKVVLALPLQSVHGTENAADAFQAWLGWSISQENKDWPGLGRPRLSLAHASLAPIGYPVCGLSCIS